MLFRCAGVCRGDRGGGFRSGSGSRLMDSGSLDAFPRVKVSCTGLGCGCKGQRWRRGRKRGMPLVTPQGPADACRGDACPEAGRKPERSAYRPDRRTRRVRRRRVEDHAHRQSRTGRRMCRRSDTCCLHVPGSRNAADLHTEQTMGWIEKLINCLQDCVRVMPSFMPGEDSISPLQGYVADVSIAWQSANVT